MALIYSEIAASIPAVSQIVIVYGLGEYQPPFIHFDRDSFLLHHGAISRCIVSRRYRYGSAQLD